MIIMNKFNFIIKNIFLIMFLLFFAAKGIFSQTEPVLYFCTGFDSKGESGVGDRFVIGPIVVVVRCDNELGTKKANVQFDKWNGTEFVYYSAVTFNLKPKVKYTWFSDARLRVDEAGIYRCFLLDENNKTITSAMVEFVSQ